MSHLETTLDALAWVALALVALAIAQLVVAWRQGRRPSLTLRGVVLGAAVGLLLAAAVGDPRSTGRPAPLHLVTVVDVSRSVLRSGKDWSEVRTALVREMRGALDRLPQDARRSRGSLVVFADGTRRVASSVELGELPELLAGLAEDDLPPPGASHLGAGLAEAEELLLETAGRGAVLLVSDGHVVGEDAEVAYAAARRLAGWGVPIHVLPRGAEEPELGLFAADLPGQLPAGSESRVRSVLFNLSPAARRLRLRRSVDGEEDLVRSVSLPAASGWTAVELPYACDRPGIHQVDLALFDGPSAAEAQAVRRFFTHCVAPARILAVAYDRRFVAALGPGFEVEAVSPEAVAASDPAGYDAVVVHGVSSESLPSAWLRKLASAVTDGTGLFLMNGPHLGDPTAPTVLMSYEETPLEELLPLRNGQRPLKEPAPPLTIFVLIDTSGSMGSVPWSSSKPWKLNKAKEIGYVLVDHLRPIDTLYLIAFADDARRLVWGERMNADGRDLAKRRIAGLQASGGTDIGPALRELDAFQLRNCGLFVLSDGEFSPARARPGCEGTAFAIGVSNAPRTLAEQAPDADPILVPNEAFNPKDHPISFFEPEPRLRRFEPGRFLPLIAPDALDRGWRPIPEPPPPFSGNALTHRRDEDTRVMVERPRPRDPVLAYRDHGDGQVGELTSPLPEAYLAGPGSDAFRRWIEEVLPYTAQDRYELALLPQGTGYELRVTLLSQAGKTPRVDVLTAALQTGGAGPEVTLRRDPELPGVFRGRLDRPSGEGKLHLVLREASGPDAERRPQKLPCEMTPAPPVALGTAAEDGVFGVDEGLLAELAAPGGGEMPAEGPLLYGSASPRTRSAAPWLLLLALAAYLGQVADRHFRRPR